MTLPRSHLRYALVGLALGFILSNVGFSSWSEVHAMFTFQHARLFGVFCGALLVAMIGYRRIAPIGVPSRISKGVVPGSILFGIGWALTGSCPSVALVQLGEGHGLALVTVAGITLGVALQSFVQARYLHWDSEGCER